MFNITEKIIEVFHDVLEASVSNATEDGKHFCMYRGALYNFVEMIKIQTSRGLN